MKILLNTLISVIFWFNVSLADNIKDFEIEGFGVGDSLLEYFTKTQIENEINSMFSYKYKGNKFVGVGVGDLDDYSMRKKINNYDRVSIAIKPNDKKFIIHSISGVIDCKADIKKCYEIKKEVTASLKDLFGENIIRTNESKANHVADKKGESEVIFTHIQLKNRKYFNISVEIYDWSERMGEENSWFDNIKISIQNDEFIKFLSGDSIDPV